LSSFFMQSLFTFLAIALLISCNNKTNGTTAVTDSATDGSVHANATDTIVTNAKPFALAGCYQMTIKKDSAFLDLNLNDTIVTGKLTFNFFEKDKNSGTLKGVLRNEQIFADYTFKSEGVTSVREIILQIKDGTLLQAYGDLKEANGKLVFADRNKLQYQRANPFIKVDCPAD
jgi:hypothetical protein